MIQGEGGRRKKLLGSSAQGCNLCLRLPCTSNLVHPSDGERVRLTHNQAREWCHVRLQENHDAYQACQNNAVPEDVA